MRGESPVKWTKLRNLLQQTMPSFQRAKSGLKAEPTEKQRESRGLAEDGFPMTEEEKAEFLAFLNEFERGVELLQKDGHGFIKYQGVEEDDIAALICAHREELGYEEIWLISSDKDWDLLVDENISRFSTVTRKETTLDNWDEHYDFDPDYYLTFKCLTGDKGDNVPGISGIGPKRASSIIQEYGDVFDIISSLPIQGNYKFIENLNEFGADNLQKNVELMDLSYDIDAQVLGKSEEILETLRNYGN